MSRDKGNCWPESQRWGLAGGNPQDKPVKSLSWGGSVLQGALLRGCRREAKRFPWSTGTFYP